MNLLGLTAADIMDRVTKIESGGKAAGRWKLRALKVEAVYIYLFHKVKTLNSVLSTSSHKNVGDPLVTLVKILCRSCLGSTS